MTSAVQADTSPETPRTLRSWWIVGNTALAPLAWLAHIAAMPALVPLSCDTGRSWFLHLATGLTAAVAALGLVGSHRTRTEVQRRDRASADADPEDPLEHPSEELVARARAWSTFGVVNGWLFLVLILAEHVPVFVLDACPP